MLKLILKKKGPKNIKKTNIIIQSFKNEEWRYFKKIKNKYHVRLPKKNQSSITTSIQQINPKKRLYENLPF